MRWANIHCGSAAPPSEFIPCRTRPAHPRLIIAPSPRLLQCGAWRQQASKAAVAINVSARDLLDRDLVSVVDVALRRHALPPAMLCIEADQCL